MKTVLLYFVILLSALSCSKSNEKVEVAPKSPLVHFVSDKKMVEIQGGTFKSFIGKDSGRVSTIKSFLLDETPVTQAEFREFVKKNPQWSKSKVLRIYADSTYLKSWPSDFELPKDRSADAPVTNVSWFAAEAYAKSVGKRLPTVEEWEFVGRADEVSADASKKPEFTEYILKSYQTKDKHLKPVKQDKPNYYGVYDMYKVWEWSEDFNSVMMSGESRKDASGDESLFCAGAAVTSDDLRNYAAFMRFALRGSLKANFCVNNLGFRCAKDLK